MSGPEDPRRFKGSRFELTIRNVRADVSYLIRTPDGRQARDIWGVGVFGHDDWLARGLYDVDAMLGVIVFRTDHPIVTVVAEIFRKPARVADRRSS